MIAVDSSTIIAFIQGDAGPDIQLLEGSIDANELVLPPVVLAEVLSDPVCHRNILLFFKLCRCSSCSTTTGLAQHNPGPNCLPANSARDCRIR